MKKGELNRRIVIMRAEPRDDGTATVPGELHAIGRRWAKKHDVSDGERLRAGQQAQDLATRFTVVSDSLTRTITGKDVIMLEGVAYQVVATKEGRGRRHNEGIEITCASQPDSVS